MYVCVGWGVEGGSFSLSVCVCVCVYVDLRPSLYCRRELAQRPRARSSQRLTTAPCCLSASGCCCLPGFGCARRPRPKRAVTTALLPVTMWAALTR